MRAVTVTIIALRLLGERRRRRARSVFAFRATSLADHIGKRITRRGARDTEEPAVGLIQIRDYTDCDRDRKRAQGDDNSGYGIEPRNEPEACKKDHQPDRQYAVE